MKNCPKCSSEKFIKNGLLRGKQRYQCKSCKYNFSKSYCGQFSPETKRQALELYLEGLGFRSIGRFLKCSHVSAYTWIRSFGKKLDGFRSNSGVEVVELDEMHTYIGSKKTSVGSGLLLIDMGKDFSTSYWVQGKRKQEENFGRNSK